MQDVKDIKKVDNVEEVKWTRKIVASTISIFKRFNESKYLLFVFIPFLLSYFISHFTLLVLIFLDTLISDFKFITNYNTYISSGSMLTTSISILVTACIGYYFSPLKPTASKLTVFKIFILFITFLVALSGIFTYIMSSGIIEIQMKLPLSVITYINFFYSMLALIIFNIWNFKADGAKVHITKEGEERAGLHK